jgi:hypothetical protein
MATMTYKSPIVRQIRGFILFLPIIFGFYEEAQEVPVHFGTLPIIEDIGESQSVQITIRPDSAQIYAAEFKMKTHLNMARFMMHNYFWTTMFLVTSSMMFAQIVAASFLVWHKYHTWTTKFNKAFGKHVLAVSAKELKPKGPQPVPVNFSHILAKPLTED